MTSKTALVLVGDPDTRRTIATALSADGIRTHCLDSARAFRSGDGSAGVDLCVISRRLSDGDGLDLVRELRAQDPLVGLIVVDERYEEVDAVLALELGADDYLAAPLRRREFRARAGAILRRMPVNGQKGHTRNPGICHIGGISIDRTTRKATLACGADAGFTDLETEVLLVLAEHVNTVLSRQQITEAVYGPDWSVNDRMVDGIIVRLRQKLFGCAEGALRIRTVRGRGYMLVEDVEEAVPAQS